MSDQTGCPCSRWWGASTRLWRGSLVLAGLEDLVRSEEEQVVVIAAGSGQFAIRVPGYAADLLGVRGCGGAVGSTTTTTRATEPDGVRRGGGGPR